MRRKPKGEVQDLDEQRVQDLVERVGPVVLCKDGGLHDPVQVKGNWYCYKCNRALEVKK